MKITFISDTHGKHQELETKSLQGDLFIHAGDVSNIGKKEGVESFLDWYKNLNFEHKIFIAGNHDYYFEREEQVKIAQLIPKEIIYLNDSGIQIEGINIWGSPIQPWFYDWAFNRKRGAEIKKHWDLIPNNTDVLITHGPPFGILDATMTGTHVGCDDLLEKVNIVKPKIHVFGHIHEAYGVRDLDGTKYINASVLDLRYRMVNSPIEIDL